MEENINKINEDIKTKQNNIVIIISSNKMSGYLRVDNINKETPVDPKDIFEKIDEYLITYGIDVEGINNYLSEGNFNNDFKFALGKEPIKGADGTVSYIYNKNDIGTIAKREDGTIDYKNLGMIQNVKKGELLCCITEPTDGFPGYNIHGEVVAPKKGATIPDIRGDNTSFTEDGLGLYSDVDGYIIYKKDKVNIQEVYTVQGDIGPETGNIDFNGAVIVFGNVLEGFSVKAKKDIQIRGIVEGANIISDGNIQISNGFNGMGKGKINAKGNIISRFIENGTVICKGDIISDTLLNSCIMVGKSIALNGGRAAIFGGKCVAGQSIFAKTLGTEHNLSTDISIKPYWYEMEYGLYYPNTTKKISEKNSIKREIEPLKEEEEKLIKELSNISKLKVLPEKREEKNKLLKYFMLEKSKVASRIVTLEQKLKEIESFESQNNYSIVCKGTVFPEVRIEILHSRMVIQKEIKYQKFYLHNDEICIGDILPSDVYDN